MRKSLLEAEQVELRKRELERQMVRDKAEYERRYSAVAKGKLFWRCNACICYSCGS